MKILAIIPARGGSKGIKNKNIRMFGGQPLIAHTVLCAKKSKFINRIVVSTDSEAIARVSKKYGAEAPFLRPAELAGDKSKVADAVIHLLVKLKKDEGYRPDYIVLLQTTSPLRLPSDIDAALELCFKRRAPAVVSLCSTEQLLYAKDKNDRLKLVSSKEFLKSTNRQQLPATYKLDGSMVYAIKTKVFLDKKTFLPENTVGYIIPRWRAVDLDEVQDFVIGELVFQKRNQLARKIKNFN